MTVIAQRTVNVYERKPLDFYPTPLSVVERLIERAGFDKGDTIWEPAAGDGAISAPLIRRGLAFMQLGQIERMMLLLPAEFDFAKGRTRLFRDNRYFCRKAVLTTRIKWFPEGGMTPTKHHAWFEWRRQPQNLKAMEWW